MQQGLEKPNDFTKAGEVWRKGDSTLEARSSFIMLKRRASEMVLSRQEGDDPDNDIESEQSGSDNDNHSDTEGRG